MASIPSPSGPADTNYRTSSFRRSFAPFSATQFSFATFRLLTGKFQSPRADSSFPRLRRRNVCPTSVVVNPMIAVLFRRLSGFYFEMPTAKRNEIVYFPPPKTDVLTLARRLLRRIIRPETSQISDEFVVTRPNESPPRKRQHSPPKVLTAFSSCEAIQESEFLPTDVITMIVHDITIA
jgi:hypothetical protein